jgi:tetratricopeptide (TPR) repeat protein
MTRRNLWLRGGAITAILLAMFVAAYARREAPLRPPGGPPAALEGALLAGDWDTIDTAAADWMREQGYRRDAAALRGYAALARGDTAAAVRHFLRAQSAGRNDASTGWAQSLASRYPYRSIAQFVTADELARQGDRHAALQRLNAVLARNPHLTLACLARAMLLAMQGERAAALRELDALAASGPLASEALACRGCVRLEQGDVAAAIADLDRAIQMESGHAVAYNTRGIARASQGQWAAACADFETGFRLAPELIQARQNWQIAQHAMRRGHVFLGKWSENQVTIVVTDFGINHWKPKMKMFGDFSLTAPSVIPNLATRGQILIPMPADRCYPKTATEKNLLKLQIAKGISDRVRAEKLGTYEVRIVQNINTMGYFAPWRQARVKDFGTIVYDGLALAKSALSNNGTRVRMPAIAGSNAGFLLTETLPRLKSNPIDSAVLVDSRAHISAARATYRALNGNLVGINTAGDALSLPTMTANHDALRALKRSLPEMRVFWADAKGPDVFFAKHLATMRPDSQLLVKEFNGTGYTRPTKTTGWGLLSESLKLNLPSISKNTRQIGPAPATLPGARGGVWMGPIDVARGAGGRVVFGSGAGKASGLRLVYTLFAAEEAKGESCPAWQR